MRLKAPYPWFGGKSAIARTVWLRLGDVANFIEPFCGSAATLLLRPTAPRIETINDYDCMVANFWRATKHAPEDVVEHCDGPVNECDLHARHRWLVYSDDAVAFRKRMRTDPDYFDAKIAGWWCWGLCMWIGSGWCTHPEWEGRGSAVIGGDFSVGRGVTKHGQLPQLRGDSGAAGSGVHPSGKRPKQKRPRAHREHRSEGGTMPGIHVRPQLADAYDIGRGVHASPKSPAEWVQRPQLEDSGGRGVISPGGTCAERRAWLLDWFGRLQDRLRNVRVCCGDWERVCGSPSVTTRLGMTGVFLDSPYCKHIERMHQWAAALRGEGPEPESSAKSTNRSAALYGTDGGDVDHLVARVHNYCRERGDDPQMRIAVCGYDGEHNALEELGWQVLAWKTNGGYANRQGGGANENAERERIWFSPHCIAEMPTDSQIGQLSLFQ